MKKPITLASLIALVALLLAACGGGSAPAVAEPTAAPTAAPTEKPTAVPTAVPTAKPTAVPTAVPTTKPAPTAAASSSGTTGGSAPAAIADAVAKAKEVKVYRVAIDMSGQGALGELSPGTDANQEIPLISLSGEFNGQDSHFTMKGLVAAFLGVEPDKGFEVISVGGKGYIRGPLPMLGATENRWYIAPEEQDSLTKPQVEANQFLEAFAGENTDLSMLTKTGSEQLDNQQCDVYAGDKEASIAAFKSLSEQGGSPPTDFGEIEDASFKFWVCDDGYLHQMQLSVTGTSKDQPNQKASFKINLHMYDFNADIKIEAPEDAAELQMPSFMLPTTNP